MSSVYVVCWIFLQTVQTYFCIHANSVYPDQTAPRGAVWSGSTLFAKMTFKITRRWQSRRQLLWLAVYGLIIQWIIKQDYKKTYFVTGDWSQSKRPAPSSLSEVKNCIHPEYSYILTSYHTCSKMWRSLSDCLSLCLTIAGWVVNVHTWTGSVFWSGYTLFTQACLFEYLG